MTLEAFTKHNDFNRMRGEVFFSGELDREVGIDFTKRAIVLSQGLKDKLLDALRPQCTTIKSGNRHEKPRENKRRSTHCTRRQQRRLKEKSKLFIKPKPNGTRGAVKSTTEGVGADRKPGRHAGHRHRVRFVSERLGPNGQIFECDQEGNVVTIRWNIEHIFYQRSIMDSLSNDRLVTGMDHLIYSMAVAELNLRQDDTVELLNNMRSIMSNNLRTLLS